MKIILSRKGFDSQYGRQPSPILPDGTLLSMPIPSKNEIYKYTELCHNGKSFYQIIKDLKPNSPIQFKYTCHLDPDLRFSVLERSENWKPIFGQVEAAQGHLKKQEISIGDIFLFFGWFRQTEFINGKYFYKSGSPDLHIIYSYFQIGEVFCHGQSFPDYSKHHPHTREKFQTIKSNCIYIARDKLTLNENYPGANNMKFRHDLILTKKGMSRSKWELPDFFKDLVISYHTKDSFKQNYFQSASKGQEFVIEANDDLIDWVMELITMNNS
jgi:hypothetical protein